MASGSTKVFQSKIRFTPSFPRDTLTNVTDNYAIKNGSCVNVRCTFTLGQHGSGNSYIDMEHALPFGTSAKGSYGFWLDETGNTGGVLKSSLNNNLWFVEPSTGANISLASKQGNMIIIRYTYFLE